MTAAERLTLQVITPAQTLVSAKGASVVHVRLADGGGIGILPRHAPLIAATVAGDLRYVDADGEHTVWLASGILHVEKDSVTVLTTGPVEPDEEVTSVPNEEARFDRLAEALLTRKGQEWTVDQGYGTAEDET